MNATEMGNGAGFCICTSSAPLSFFSPPAPMALALSSCRRKRLRSPLKRVMLRAFRQRSRRGDSVDTIPISCPIEGNGFQKVGRDGKRGQACVFALYGLK